MMPWSQADVRVGPLAQILECEQLMTQHFAALRALALDLQHGRLDAHQRTALLEAMRFFDEVAPLHYADEQEDLFPALLESMAGSDAVCLHDLTQSLSADHRMLQDAWQRLRPRLQDALQGQGDPLRIAELHAFIELQDVHAQREDDELLPMAERLLDDDALMRIAQAMKQRRSAG